MNESKQTDEEKANDQDNEDYMPKEEDKKSIQIEIDPFIIGVAFLFFGLFWVTVEEGSPEIWYFYFIPASWFFMGMGLLIVGIAIVRTPGEIANHLRKWCSYPTIGDYIATIFAILPGAVITIPFEDNEAARLILLGLITTLWTLFLERKDIFRITLPLVPIPLWICGIAVTIWGFAQLAF